jgi:hypothetical protein
MGRPLRWSKKTDELVRFVAQRCRPSFQSELGHWLEDSARFSVFLTTHKDKVRKKLTTSDNEDVRQDVRAELLVAYRLLADRRMELAFEAYGAHQIGPDFTVTYRANQRFNIEVTRVREARLDNVIVGKLRQLPTDLPNALVVLASANQEQLSDAMRQLKQRSEAKDPRAANYRNLSGVFVFDAANDVYYVDNREARRPLAKEAVQVVSACLRVAGQKVEEDVG